MLNSEKITEPYGFLKILHFPRNVFYKSILTPTELNILSAVVSYSDKNGLIRHFSAQEVANNIGKSRQSVSKHVLSIVNKGVLNQIDTKASYHNHYRINFDVLEENNTATLLSCQSATPEVAQGATQLSCTKKEIENREIKKDKTTLSRNEFLDEVCFLLNQGELDEYIHYGERTIKEQAKLCYDHHMARADILPSNNIASIMRNWLHKAIAVNAIDKNKNENPASSTKDHTKKHYTDMPNEEWRRTIVNEIGINAYNIWFKDCIVDTIDKKLLASSPTKATYITQKYEHIIARTLPNYTVVSSND